MKKSLIFTAFAVALSLGTFQVEAKKSAARKRFDESLDRVQRCFKGKCTRMEALKAARDLGIAAATVIGGMYVAGRGLETLGEKAIHKATTLRGQAGAAVLGGVGYQLQRPARRIYGAGAAGAARVQQEYQKRRRGPSTPTTPTEG